MSLVGSNHTYPTTHNICHLLIHLTVSSDVYRCLKIRILSTCSQLISRKYQAPE